MIKVLHILDALNRGGAEVLVLDICRNASKNGLDVSFAATGGGDLEEDFRSSGVEFYRLQRRLPIDPFLIARLRAIILKNSIAVVHTHQAVEALHAYFACRNTPAKLVLSFHGYIPDAKNRHALKFLIPRTNANIAVSREFYEMLGGEEKFDTTQNFSVIHNGVDEKRLTASGKDIRTELNIPAEALLYGMIGNFYAAPRKDQLTVCRALPEFFRQINNAQFVFVGGLEQNSPYDECVAFCRDHGISDRVHFVGRRGDVADILSALDVFVLSTRHESFGIAAVEAMLKKVPMVLSDLRPLLEVTDNGRFAEMFETGNADELTEKMIMLAADDASRADLADRAYAHAAANFSIEAHLAALKSLYESII